MQQRIVTRQAFHFPSAENSIYFDKMEDTKTMNTDRDWSQAEIKISKM